MKLGPLCALLWRILTWQHHSGCLHKDSGCLHKQRGEDEAGPSVCPSVENPDLVYEKTGYTQSPTHSRLTECGSRKLSRLAQTIKTEWSLLPEVLKAICNRWHQPQVDLFATSFNNKLANFVSPVLDPLAWAFDALSLPWQDLDQCAFPLVAILSKVVKLQDYPCGIIILIAPGWPNMPWFWDLVTIVSDHIVSAQPAHSTIAFDSVYRSIPEQELDQQLSDEQNYWET